jgi:hypothetical protein
MPAAGEGLSPVRGVWDGVGLALTTSLAAAATDVELPPGRYRVTAQVDTATPSQRPEARLELRAHATTLGSTLLPQPQGAPPARIQGVVDHLGGSLHLEIAAERLWPSPIFIAIPVLWVSDFKIESDLH